MILALLRTAPNPLRPRGRFSRRIVRTTLAVFCIAGACSAAPKNAKSPTQAKASTKTGPAKIAPASHGQSGSAANAGLSLVQQLQSTIARLPHPGARSGACVIDLKTDQLIFDANAAGVMTPASNMKVFAMAVALVELGQDFHFETVLATDGTNLLVIGDGDPGFGDEKLCARRGEKVMSIFERWATALAQSGMHRFDGDLIYDDFVFDDIRVHPSWEKDDLGKWYAAPVSGLMINDACIDVTITPAGSNLLVTAIPPTGLNKIVNQARIGEGTPLLHYAAGSNEYRISGRTKKAYAFGAVPVRDPSLTFTDSLRTVLANHGVTVAGQIRRARIRQADGSLPPQARLLAKQRTPLADVLNRAGKDSQNLFAECLLKRAGFAWAKRHGAPQPQGSWDTGRGAVMEMLQRAGIDASGFAIADGSGLSRDNRCTAKQLAAISAWMRKGPAAELFLDSLAVAGVDGSLKKRLKQQGGRVHAKTGTMNGIRTLSGYVEDDQGPRYAFAVMFNGYKGGAAPYKDLQDRFCRVLTATATGTP